MSRRRHPLCLLSPADFPVKVALFNRQGRQVGAAEIGLPHKPDPGWPVGLGLECPRSVAWVVVVTARQENFRLVNRLRQLDEHLVVFILLGVLGLASVVTATRLAGPPEVWAWLPAGLALGVMGWRVSSLVGLRQKLAGTPTRGWVRA